MLGYCQELGVPLEVEVNASRSALMQADVLNGGKAVQERQVVYDTRACVIFEGWLPLRHRLNRSGVRKAERLLS